MAKRIVYQGEAGAYSHQACAETFPDAEATGRASFEAVIAAVRDGEAELAMLPVENTTYGRVADIHRLLPGSGLHIIGEAFVRVHINLLGVQGAKLEDVKEAASHLVLLPQCAKFLSEHGIRGVVSPDNARAAREVAEAALSHTVGDRAEQAYRRGDALEKRRGLMSLWAEYCNGQDGTQIVRLRG